MRKSIPRKAASSAARRHLRQSREVERETQRIADLLSRPPSAGPIPRIVEEHTDSLGRRVRRTATGLVIG